MDNELICNKFINQYLLRGRKFVEYACSKPDKPNTIQKIINTVKTGDTTNIGAWFLIAIVSLGLIVGFYKKRKLK